MDVEKLRAILAALQGTDVTRLDWTNGQERITLRMGHPPAPVTALHAVPAGAPGSSAALPTPPQVTPVVAAASPAARDNTFTVNSPFVGTFYRAASPDNPSFVEVGQVVKKGQVLCIVEAMKLMNEIEAEQPGRLLEALIQNGSPVEYGEPLFRFEPV
ncbi:MAG TPA: acetyl-CoA carboxylase biotin carboxyl carrier protein [Myxococcales bacterium]|jgi:acetyl-CoA carboxylase biotin carboxyl carrier protein|nr:acetyl-CoA carboxylase biotin carboxyl carrier protein [Myxococcales bacterium]